MTRTELIFPLLLTCALAFSQKHNDTKAIVAEAQKKMQNENYEDAIDDFLQLLSTDPKNETYNYDIGVCYLNSNVNKAKAVPYLEIVTRKEKYNPNAAFLLGRAYQYANRFDDAIEIFKKFKTNLGGSEENLKIVNQEIQYCINAKEIVKFPVNVVYQSLGKIINSQFAYYYPFVTDDEAFVVFNSKRPYTKDAEKKQNGEYANSIYISKVISGQYTTAEVIGDPICKGNSGEEVIGMNSKGNIIMFNKPDSKGGGKMYISYMDEQGKFGKPELLPSPINGNGADDIAACINSEGTTIYFASDRSGGIGGTDIYVCRKLANGKWSEPKNLGPQINTVFDEDFPDISPDGKTFYFSSTGHASMGGYDIFKAQYDETLESFINPKNLGYPINTSFDDMNFRISKSGRFGYLASLRGGGTGDYDIYRVTFGDVEVDYTVIVAEIKAQDNAEVSYKDVFITVNENGSGGGELVGNYAPNPNNGRSIIILSPGKYILNVEAPGYKNYSIPIEIYDKVSYQSEKSFVIELKK